MMRAKQPFVFSTCPSPVARAVGRLAGRRDRSLPAFANCTLDDNIGEGDRRSGNGWNSSQVNGYVMWDPETVTDQPDEWAITVWVDESSYYSEATVDVTPRRCRRFKGKPGQKFNWTNAVLPPPAQKDDKADPKEAADEPKEKAPPARTIQQSTATADEHGLVTIEKLTVSKRPQRVTIRPAR